MTYRDVIEETETHRVVLMHDDDPQGPDFDGQGFIFQVRLHGGVYGGPSTDLRHHDYGDKAKADSMDYALNGALHHAYERGLDEWDFAERYLRAFHGVRSFDRISWDRDDLVCIVTTDHIAEWGCADDVAAKAASGVLETWRQYGEGDVYGYAIEERTHRHTTVTHADGTVTEEDEDEWADTDDSCWGFYGLEYATEAARDALTSYRTEEASA